MGLACSPLPGTGHVLRVSSGPTEPCRQVAYSHCGGDRCGGRYLARGGQLAGTQMMTICDTRGCWAWQEAVRSQTDLS